MAHLKSAKEDTNLLVKAEISRWSLIRSLPLVAYLAAVRKAALSWFLESFLSNQALVNRCVVLMGF